MTITIPLALPSVANQRLHWRAKAAQVKRQRHAVAFAVWCSTSSINGPWPERPPYSVLLTRIGPRKLDSDNLASAFKAVRDQVARLLYVDDGDESRVTWAYGQEKGPPSIRIEVLAAGTPAIVPGPAAGGGVPGAPTRQEPGFSK